MKSFLVSNQVSSAVSKTIASFYQKLSDELTEAALGKDKQLKEGYSNLTKPQLNKFRDLVNQIIADCNQQAVITKAARKPRTVKVKPPAVVAAKIKPLKEYSDLKLTSIEPFKIIGAKELWTYVPEKRKLSVYVSISGSSLNVSGTSITNYDSEKSHTKTVRKPEEFFKDLNLNSKITRSNAWKKLKATPSTVRSRVTTDTMILAVG
jgi:hypothetical protein